MAALWLDASTETLCCHRMHRSQWDHCRGLHEISYESWNWEIECRVLFVGKYCQRIEAPYYPTDAQIYNS